MSMNMPRWEPEQLQKAADEMSSAARLLAKPSGPSMAAALEALRRSQQALCGLANKGLPPAPDDLQELLLDLARSRWIVMQMLAQIGVALEDSAQDLIFARVPLDGALDVEV